MTPLLQFNDVGALPTELYLFIFMYLPVACSHALLFLNIGTPSQQTKYFGVVFAIHTAGNGTRTLLHPLLGMDLAMPSLFPTMKASLSCISSSSLSFTFTLLNVYFLNYKATDKVIELKPTSYSRYQLKHAVLHGAHRYDEAIETVKIMISKLENTSDKRTQNLGQKHVSPSEAEHAIEESINGPPCQLYHLVHASPQIARCATQVLRTSAMTIPPTLSNPTSPYVCNTRSLPHFPTQSLQHCAPPVLHWLFPD
ncbi:hypothetical protein EV424DRAFT_1585951 [Suillus variegatus]|nr:hypothetical protein EV424DRAFT_1585951 [Suillus variegatus]